jgi:leucyl aminopeptidase
MITIQVRDIKSAPLEKGVTALFVEQDTLDTPLLREIAKIYFPHLLHAMAEQKFSGKLGSSFVLPIVHEQAIAHILFIGLGKRGQNGMISVEQYRRAVGYAVRTAEQYRWSSLQMRLPFAQNFGITDAQLAEYTVIALKMAHYYFDEFITDPMRKFHVTNFTLIPEGHDVAALEQGMKTGRAIAHGVNQCRRWIDLPPAYLTPVELATVAQKIAKAQGLSYTVFGEQEINEMGMGGLAAVSRGSARDCQFVIMEYHCGKKNAPTLGFVGKGITFDSGGLSIKPAEYMENMKDDMSGAAAVIASMEVLAQLKPSVNIVAFAPLAENIPSDKATKPGDIATFYNGKTAEIKNTDAEGRLILADALSYAEKHYTLDCIVDLATLTGACAHALGPFYSGLMSFDDELVARLQKASEQSGDKLWRLPLDDDYRPAIKSPIADIQNIGSKRYMAGTITAALFLSNFVEKTPWAHIDIAGTAFNVPDLPYYRPEGATGVGVRLLVALAMNWQ